MGEAGSRTELQRHAGGGFFTVGGDGSAWTADGVVGTGMICVFGRVAMLTGLIFALEAAAFGPAEASVAD